MCVSNIRIMVFFFYYSLFPKALNVWRTHTRACPLKNTKQMWKREKSNNTHLFQKNEMKIHTNSGHATIPSNLQSNSATFKTTLYTSGRQRKKQVLMIYRTKTTTTTTKSEVEQNLTILFTYHIARIYNTHTQRRTNCWKKKKTYLHTHPGSQTHSFTSHTQHSR